MSDINNLWVSYLMGQGYAEKSYNDLIKTALQDKTPSSRKQINDLWGDFLLSKGYSGSVNTALYNYLGSIGYKGSLNDRLRQSLITSDFFHSAADVINNLGSDLSQLFEVDPAYLYQDSTGTTPAVVGQPVGLMLDISRGLVRGSELATNGTFDAGLTGWTSLGGTTLVNGAVRIVSPDGSDAGLSQSLAVTANKHYVIEADISVTSGQGYVSLGDSTISDTNPSRYVFSESGRLLVYVIAGSVTTNFVVSQNGACDFTVDNISVTEIPGYHAKQITTASKPILRRDSSGRHYLETDGVDDFMTFDAINSSSTARYLAVAGLDTATDSGTRVMYSPGAAEYVGSANIVRAWISFIAGSARVVGNPKLRSTFELLLNGTVATVQAQGDTVTVDPSNTSSRNYTTLFRFDSAGNYWKGRFYGSTVCANSTLNEQKRTLVRNYLNDRAGATS